MLTASPFWLYDVAIDDQYCGRSRVWLPSFLEILFEVLTEPLIQGTQPPDLIAAAHDLRLTMCRRSEGDHGGLAIGV
jgi:hypothetical protein